MGAIQPWHPQPQDPGGAPREVPKVGRCVAQWSYPLLTVSHTVFLSSSGSHRCDWGDGRGWSIGPPPPMLEPCNLREI